jgi:hypothetical protein
VLTLYETNSLHVFSLGEMGGVSAVRVDDGPYVSSAFHTATTVDGDSVVLVGGARRTDDVPLVALNQVVRVRETSGGYMAGSLVPEFAGGLIQGRFGHATVEIGSCTPADEGCRDRRLLITGGLEASGSGGERTFRALQTAEVLHFGPLAPPIAPGCSAIVEADAGTPTGMDGGIDASMDAGTTDGGPVDAGALDSGPPTDGATLDGSAGVDGGPVADAG